MTDFWAEDDSGDRVTGFWAALSCSHPTAALIVDPEGDRICGDCGLHLPEQDLEADMLRALAAYIIPRR